MKFKPSKYQQAIFDYLSGDFDQNLVVNAVAGSGKTTTLVESVKLMKGNTLFLAFNKHIAESLSEKMPEAECRTNHSLGFGALSNVKSGSRLDNWKYNNLIRDFVRNGYFSYPERELVATSAKLADLARMSLTPETIEDVQDLAYYYGIDYYGPEIELALRAIDDGRKMWEYSGIIDYGDMIYLPVHYGYKLNNGYDNIFVDEAQDLSAAQLALVRAIGGKMAFVGDRKQAVFGFAGADPESVNRIIAQTDAIEMPLSICYRCPAGHIRLAQQIVPQIEPREDAPDGVIDSIAPDLVQEEVRVGDLIISRTTAPLVRLCLSLIASRVPAYVRGRDIGKGLISVVNNIAKMRGFRWDDFGKYLESWRNTEVNRLMKKQNSESAVSALLDRYESIEAIYYSSNANTVTEFTKEIDLLFNEGGDAVMLSTVHRAKGLEADRVFILEPERMPLRWANQLPWQYEQEMNIYYVALTRAKQELWFIEE